MARDCRDLLEVLRFELYILQPGACRNANVGSRAPLSFAEFIPGNHQNETPACHTIPLGEQGNTIAASLGRGYNRLAVAGAVFGWLRETVARLERERRQELVACS